MSKPERRVCVDCVAEGVTTRRPAPYGGVRSPRCKTHDRRRRNQAREAAWERRLWVTYHLTPDQYWALYEAQGGVCYLCRRATGKAKRLAVDHDHACCDGPVSCGRCVRGLCCGQCNKILGHARDEVEFFERGAEYLRNPPAREVLGLAPKIRAAATLPDRPGAGVPGG